MILDYDLNTISKRIFNNLEYYNHLAESSKLNLDTSFSWTFRLSEAKYSVLIESWKSIILLNVSLGNFGWKKNT